VKEIDPTSIFLIYIRTSFASGMERLTAELENWAAERSVRNMLQYYRKALNRLKRGEFMVDSVPQGTRKSLVEYGIIRKFGNKFELTELGAKLL